MDNSIEAMIGQEITANANTEMIDIIGGPAPDPRVIELQTLTSGSKGNCYQITDGISRLLLECGTQYRLIQQWLEFKTCELAGCLITHEHQDHAKAVKDLAGAGINCFMSQGTAEALGASGHRIKIIKAGQQFKVGSFTVMPFETQHDTAEPLGFLLQSQSDKILFATDTCYIRYKFNNLNIIAVECNYSLDILNANVESGEVPLSRKNRTIQSHFSLANLKDFLKANDLHNAREIHLLHLSNSNSDAVRFKREIQELTGKPTYIAEG